MRTLKINEHWVTPYFFDSPSWSFPSWSIFLSARFPEPSGYFPSIYLSGGQARFSFQGNCPVTSAVISNKLSWLVIRCFACIGRIPYLGFFVPMLNDNLLFFFHTWLFFSSSKYFVWIFCNYSCITCLSHIDLWVLFYMNHIWSTIFRLHSLGVWLIQNVVLRSHSLSVRTKIYIYI